MGIQQPRTTSSLGRSTFKWDEGENVLAPRVVLSSLVRPGTDSLQNRLKYTVIRSLEMSFFRIP